MPFQVSTHASLLHRLGVDGDDDVWREFHDRYHALVRGFARRRGLQPIDADDVAQEVLMAVHRSIRNSSFEVGRGRFRGYLKSIALRTIWRREAERRRDLVNIDDDDDFQSVVAAPETDAMWEAEWRQYHMRLALHRIAAEFPATEVRAFELLTVEARSSDSVAADLNWPIDRVYRVKSVILARLKAVVAAQVAEEG